MEQTENRVNITHNGQEMSALNLLPNIDNKEIAVVDFGVLQRLANLLPKADFYEIKRNFISKLDEIRDMECFVALLEDELAFQKTVNLITIIGKEDIQPIAVVASPSSYADNGEDEEDREG